MYVSLSLSLSLSATVQTRNSPIADKRRDAVVQYAMAWLTTYNTSEKLGWAPPILPFKVTQGHDTDRSGTYDFLLVFHSNHNTGLSSVRVIGEVSKGILSTLPPCTREV